MKKATNYVGRMQTYRRRNPYKMAYNMIYKAGKKLFYAGVVIALLVWLFKLI